MLLWTDTPMNVYDQAVEYMRIYFIGIPFCSLYNFAAAPIRSIGDSRTPMLILLFSGVVNVLLNLFFVSVCKMDAAGVAIATKISSVISAVLVLRTLHNSDGAIRLVFKKIRFHWKMLKEVLWIGIPAGLQGALYVVSNLFIQSSVNSLGSAAMAGNAASQSLEGVANIASTAYYQSAMSFTGQNLGGKKYKRIIRSILVCLFYAVTFSIVCGIVFLAAGRTMLGWYNPDATVVAWGMERFVIMMSSFFLCGIMDTISGALRGLGHSIKPMLTTIICACGLRIAWVFVVFPHFGTLRSLAVSYPTSWIMTGLINGLILLWVCRKMLQKARSSRSEL
jgi:Na+-driven multidrug efflux pump